MSLLSYGSIESLVEGSRFIVAEADRPLPGLTLKKYTLHSTGELFSRWNKAEVYMFGVAADGSGKILTIPLGQDELAKQGSNALLVKKVGLEETVEYLGAGLPLVLPPTKDFLSIRLLIADSDATARAAAAVIKAIGEAVATKEAIAALVSTGLPHAAAVAIVTGKALEAASKMMEANKDDVIETFEGYFTAGDMTNPEGEEPRTLTVQNAGASAEFVFVAP